MWCCSLYISEFVMLCNYELEIRNEPSIGSILLHAIQIVQTSNSNYGYILLFQSLYRFLKSSVSISNRIYNKFDKDYTKL